MRIAVYPGTFDPVTFGHLDLVERGRKHVDRLIIAILRNEDKQPRWALLPSHLPSRAGGIDKLEQLTATAGTTRIAVGRFLGTGGRYAVRLAPGAHLTLRRLEVAWWRAEEAKGGAFDVQFADEVLLAGEAMAGWFDGDPTIHGAVEVDMGAARHTASRRAPGDKEVAILLTGATAVSARLSPP